MSLKRAGSLFDRHVKVAFNKTKYANLTARSTINLTYPKLNIDK